MKSNVNSRKLVNTNSENIKVMVRLRPLNQNEIGQPANFVTIDGNSIQTVNLKNEHRKFDFDYVAGQNSTQEEVFQNCSMPLCESALEGYNCTIFAYGQTGSGKTFTLQGKEFSTSENVNGCKDKYRMLPRLNNQFNPKITFKANDQQNDQRKTNDSNRGGISNPQSGNNLMNDPFAMQIDDDPNAVKPSDTYNENFGLLPRTINYLFEASRKRTDCKISFMCSYIEIYQDNIYDLLDPTYNKKVTLRDVSAAGAKNSIVLEGMTKFKISSPQEAFNIVKQGSKLRHIAETAMNRESSRSHALFTLYITNEMIMDRKKVINKSMFHIIDLAGSERQSATKAEGERVKEAGNINMSLLSLGKVITALTNKKTTHIPYRECKLTHFLKDSLGGNAKTSIIANISPLNASIEETISTLQFAQRAKTVKNQAMINSEFSNVDSQVKEEFMKLKGKYESIRQENLRLKKELQKTLNQKDRQSKSMNDSFMEDDMEALGKEITKKDDELKQLQEVNDSLKDQIKKMELNEELKQKDMKDLEQEILNQKNTIDQKDNELRNYATSN
ncbi:MAG: hypothetical protein MJ252_28255, partial [archaeon]|nr:hypothetical protein [archaeon]